MKRTICCLIVVATISCHPVRQSDEPALNAVYKVLEQELGKKDANLFQLRLIQGADSAGHDEYKASVKGDKLLIEGTTPVALCRGAYNVLRHIGEADISWSGNHISIPQELPVGYSEKNSTPYKYRYYFNVVTHGYTTPYWGWDRWEKEIDWMAVHGINMPLLGGAYEAIMYRVFKDLGLHEQEISHFFTGPAFLPWNRMGNITLLDSPLPGSYYDKQIKLTHQILDRMKMLGMHPIIQAFAGFVPDSIKRLYPDVELRDLSWGGFPKAYNAHILPPGSPLFEKIGSMFIREWEKEFGKAEFYLADSFNEMQVPLSRDSTQALKELSQYGESVYRSIHEADTSATWVMQGWTFPFERDRKTGKLFWTPQRFHALVSKVPDNKLLILDMANEYNRVFWKIQPSWKMFPGFFGKEWIYSFIPNMGGKTSWNGRLDIYASIPIEALHYSGKGNLSGFGFAPEGIENNGIIYELLSDIAWRRKAIDLNKWIGEYCRDRYGAFPASMKEAYSYFLKSCYGSFTDHPRFKYELGPLSDIVPSVNNSPEFVKGVEYFLQSRDSLSANKLYMADALEVSTQFLGLTVDSLLDRFEKTKDYTVLQEALDLMVDIDRLLVSHPTWQLEKWVRDARNFGDDDQEKNYYEADAKKLITIWGDEGEITDYAARTWSGLIKDYYMPRWELYYEAKKEHRKFDLLAWERAWVNKPWKPNTQPFERPLEKVYELVEKYKHADHQ